MIQLFGDLTDKHSYLNSELGLFLAKRFLPVVWEHYAAVGNHPDGFKSHLLLLPLEWDNISIDFSHYASQCKEP